MNQLTVDSLEKRFDEVDALGGVSFDVKEGEFFCVVGPTNAGKSTLLKTIAGLHRPDRGTVSIKGRDVTQQQPRDRNVSLLFQNIALFPTLSGFDNIAFPMSSKNADPEDIKRRVGEVAEMLRVTHLLDRLPQTYSGGEQQRVAIGRAIIQPADLLMLDEPLTNLDARLRIELRIEFKKIHRELGQSLIYVTHDQVEAMSLSDRIAVLHEGKFQQIGTPSEIYERPANEFVARFVGQPPMNILDVDLERERDVLFMVSDRFRMPLPLPADEYRMASANRIAVGVRPEAVRLAPTESPRTPVCGTVEWIERLGHRTHVDIRLGQLFLRAAVASGTDINVDENVWAGFDIQPHQFLDRDTGRFFRM